MLHIYRREIGKLRICFVFIILLLIASTTFAQERELYLTDHDSKPYYFGITLGANVASFHIEHHPRFLQYDSVYTVNPQSTAGFQLGLLATARLSNRFEVRFNPQLLFTDRGLTYKLKYTDLFEQSDSITKKIESVITTFPLQIKFFSDRIGNFRVYMLAGVKADIDLASNARSKRAEELVKIQKYDYGIEAGIGFNFYFRVLFYPPRSRSATVLKTFTVAMRI